MMLITLQTNYLLSPPTLQEGLRVWGLRSHQGSIRVWCLGFRGFRVVGLRTEGPRVQDFKGLWAWGCEGSFEGVQGVILKELLRVPLGDLYG